MPSHRSASVPLWQIILPVATCVIISIDFSQFCAQCCAWRTLLKCHESRTPNKKSHGISFKQIYVDGKDKLPHWKQTPDCFLGSDNLKKHLAGFWTNSGSRDPGPAPWWMTVLTALGLSYCSLLWKQLLCINMAPVSPSTTYFSILLLC
jgi:hypothetical protein